MLRANENYCSEEGCHSRPVDDGGVKCPSSQERSRREREELSPNGLACGFESECVSCLKRP